MSKLSRFIFRFILLLTLLCFLRSDSTPPRGDAEPTEGSRKEANAVNALGLGGTEGTDHNFDPSIIGQSHNRSVPRFPGFST